MKKAVALFFLLSGIVNFSTITAQNEKAYVKFVEPIIKKFNRTNLGASKLEIEFRSKKEATVYIELIEKGEIVGGSTYSGKAKKPEVISMSLKKYAKKILTASSDYNLKLYCFLGPKNTFKEKIGETILVDDIRVSRL